MWLFFFPWFFPKKEEVSKYPCLAKLKTELNPEICNGYSRTPTVIVLGPAVADSSSGYQLAHPVKLPSGYKEHPEFHEVRNCSGKVVMRWPCKHWTVSPENLEFL